MVLERRSENRKDEINAAVSDVSRSQVEVLQGMETIVDAFENLLRILKRVLDRTDLKEETLQVEISQTHQSFQELKNEIRKVATLEDQVLDQVQTNLVTSIQQLMNIAEAISDKLDAHKEYATGEFNFATSFRAEIRETIKDLIEQVTTVVGLGNENKVMLANINSRMNEVGSATTQNSVQLAAIVEARVIYLAKMTEILEKMSNVTPVAKDVETLVTGYWKDKYRDRSGNAIAFQDMLKEWFFKNLEELISKSLFYFLLLTLFWWITKGEDHLKDRVIKEQTAQIDKLVGELEKHKKEIDKK